MPGQNATAPSLKPHTMQGMHGLRVHAGNTAACAAGRRRACIGVFSCQGSCPVNSSHRITPYEYTARPAGLGAAAQRAPGTGRQPGCAHAGRLPHVAPATAPLFACQACCCSERAVHACSDCLHTLWRPRSGPCREGPGNYDFHSARDAHESRRRAQRQAAGRRAGSSPSLFSLKLCGAPAHSPVRPINGKAAGP